jgi:hypothetical protein
MPHPNRSKSRHSNNPLQWRHHNQQGRRKLPRLQRRLLKLGKLLQVPVQVNP